MARITGIALAVAASLVLAACGGASDKDDGTTATAPSPRSAEQVVVGVAQDYSAAYLDGDYATACRLLTPAARASYLDAAAATGDGTCPAVMESVVGAADDGAAGGTAGIRVTVVSLKGDRAVVRTAVEGQAETLTLRRAGGRWRVDAGL